LNYQTLPDIRLRPDSFATIAEAGERADEYHQIAGKTVFLVGSRAHIPKVSEAAAEVAKAGFNCAETKFFMSTVFTCTIQ
jgi:hypothetical protein